VRLAVLVLGAACAAAALALSGCGTGGYSTEGSQGAGRQLFLNPQTQCGACHTLADAGTRGTIGPNLDDAFLQAREDGMTTDTFIQVVRDQILFPITETSTGATGMPGPDTTLPECDGAPQDAFCVDDQHQAAEDIAVYVGSVAGTGGAAAPPPGGGEATDGKSIFTANCAACHTLADAGTTGTVGPNLDQSRPSKELAVDRVTNGQGAMPSFKDSLDPAQIEAVAEYVSSAAGR
jgi:mono/diheme cytochrome c family protein